MNWEKIKNIGEHIETEDKRERKDILNGKIAQISLTYAEKKFQEKKGQDDGYRFSDAVKEFTPVRNIVLNPVYRLENPNLHDNQEKINAFLDDFYASIDALHDEGDFDPERILKLIEAERSVVKEYLGLQDLEEHDRKQKEIETDILRFNVINNIGADSQRKYEDLEKLGFSRFDRFLEIHLEEFYQANASHFGPDLIKNDFGKLAEYIIDKEKAVAAVLGRSWLLSTPIAERLGFHKIDETTLGQLDLSAWLQFIDKDGDIDQKRLSRFLETGELPYQSVRGYIATEDFLRRYLPPERRGKVCLKAAKPDRRDFWTKMQEDIQTVKTDWDEFLKSKGGFERFIEKNGAVNKVLDLFAPADKECYLAFLKSMYEADIPWGNFREHQDEKIKALDEKITRLIDDDLYEDKEIVID